MRVYRVRNGAGFWQTEVSGSPVARASPRPVPYFKKIEKQRHRAGQPVPVALIQSQRRKGRYGGHGLPRNCTLGAVVDSDVMEIFITEAARRGIPKGALSGTLLEIIADDDLFDAILGKVK